MAKSKFVSSADIKMYSVNSGHVVYGVVEFFLLDLQTRTLIEVRTREAWGKDNKKTKIEQAKLANEIFATILESVNSCELKVYKISKIDGKAEDFLKSWKPKEKDLLETCDDKDYFEFANWGADVLTELAFTMIRGGKAGKKHRKISENSSTLVTKAST